METTVRRLINRFMYSFLIMVAMFTFSVEFFNWLTPVHFWYEYNELNPVMYVGVNEVGDPLFISDVVYKRDVTMEWFDTPFCLDCDEEQKLQTQYWTDFKTSESVFSSSWAYTADDLIPGKTYQMCGQIKGYTPSTTFKAFGYTKSDSYCTDEFIYNP